MLRISTNEEFRAISQDAELFHKVHENLQVFLDDTITDDDLSDDQLVQLIENEEKPERLEDTKSFYYYKNILRQISYISDSDTS